MHMSKLFTHFGKPQTICFYLTQVFDTGLREIKEYLFYKNILSIMDVLDIFCTFETKGSFE